MIKSLKNSVFALLWSELTIFNIGFFAVLSSVAYHLVENLEFTAVEASIAMICSTAGLRFTRILAAPFLNKIPARVIIPAAVITSAICYLLLALASSLPFVCLLLFLAGSGYGCNGVLITTIASHTDKPILTRYALMNTGTNIAASIGPLIAGYLSASLSPSAPFIFAGLTLIPSIVIALRLPPLPDLNSELPWIATIKHLTRDSAFRRIFLLSILGWFAYTQKFSSLAIFLGSYHAMPELIGVFFTINALGIIALSIPLGKLASSKGYSGLKVIPIALCLYAAAFLLLAVHPSLNTAFASLALWTIGEAALMPALNSSLAETVDKDKRLIAFTLGGIAIGIGEGLGSSSGISLMKYFSGIGHPGLAYLFLFIVCALFVLISLSAERRSKFMFWRKPA